MMYYVHVYNEQCVGHGAMAVKCDNEIERCK